MPQTIKFRKAHAFVDSEGTEDSRLLCDLFFETEQKKSVTISLQVSMPDYDAGSNEAFILSYEPFHLDENKCKLHFPKNTNKSNNKANRTVNDKATLSLVLKKNHECVIWCPSKRRVRNDLFKPEPRYSQFINIVQANIVYVEFSANSMEPLYGIEFILANLSKRKGYRASKAFKNMARWNKPLFPCNENNKCNTQHLPNIEVRTQGAASLTHLSEISVPETDHSGSPDGKNEQCLVLVPDSQCSLTNSASGSSSSSLYVPDSLPKASPDHSPGSLVQKTVYPPLSGSKLLHYHATIDLQKRISESFDKASQDLIASSPSPRYSLDWRPNPEAYLGPTLNQIYRRNDNRQPTQPSHNAGLPFGGREISPEQALIGSPTRNSPASPESPGPTPLNPSEHRFQPLEMGSPTVPSFTGNDCLPALGADEPQLFASFEPPETVESSAQCGESIEHLVKKSVAAHGREMGEDPERRHGVSEQELNADWARSLSDTVRTLVQQYFEDLVYGEGFHLGKSEELDGERRRLELEEERLLEDKKCLEERTHRLNKRKREFNERRLGSTERRQTLYKKNPQ